MKMSEAVVKGREMLEPRQGNDLYPPQEGCEKYGGCYRGMAIIGAERLNLPIMDDDPPEEGYDMTDELMLAWPWAQSKRLDCPCQCSVTQPIAYKNFTILQALGHLWDKHTTFAIDSDAQPCIEALDDPWTFERITDWLRSVEPSEDSAQ